MNMTTEKFIIYDLRNIPVIFINTDASRPLSGYRLSFDYKVAVNKF